MDSRNSTLASTKAAKDTPLRDIHPRGRGQNELAAGGIRLRGGAGRSVLRGGRQLCAHQSQYRSYRQAPGVEAKGPFYTVHARHDGVMSQVQRTNDCANDHRADPGRFLGPKIHAGPGESRHLTPRYVLRSFRRMLTRCSRSRLTPLLWRRFGARVHVAALVMGSARRVMVRCRLRIVRMRCRARRLSMGKSRRDQEKEPTHGAATAGRAPGCSGPGTSPAATARSSRRTFSAAAARYACSRRNGAPRYRLRRSPQHRTNSEIVASIAARSLTRNMYCSTVMHTNSFGEIGYRPPSLYSLAYSPSSRAQNRCR